MNPSVSIEERLTAAYAVEPRDGFEAVDARIAALLAAAEQPGNRRARRRLWSILLLAAALIVLAGATIAGLRLLDEVTRATPATSLAWERGVEIGQRQTAGAYAVTLARGYADVNQVLLAVSVEPLDGSGGVPDLQATLEDPAGVELQPADLSFGYTGQEGGAEMMVFNASATVAGEYTLRLGSLTYRFSLPNAGGAVVNVDRAQTTGAGRLTLDTVRLSPTTIIARLHLVPSSPEVSDWGPVGYFRRNDLDIALDHGGGDGTAEPTWTESTFEGVDDPTGTWALVVTELVGDREDGSQVRLQGPWTFAFEVP